MTTRQLTVGLLLVLIACLAAGCSSGQQKVDSQRLLGLEGHPSLAEVERQLGGPGRHQFTALDGDGRTLLGVSYRFDGTADACLYFIFRDGELDRIVRRPERIGRTVLNGDYKVWARRPLDMEAILSDCLAAPALDRIDFAGGIARYERDAQRRGREDWNVLPAAIITAPLFLAMVPIAAPLAMNEVATNDRLAARYDPLKASIEMTREQADSLYGPPRRVTASQEDPAITLRVYGDDRDPDVTDRYSWVVVGFRDDAAVRVFSHDFADRSAWPLAE